MPTMSKLTSVDMKEGKCTAILTKMIYKQKVQRRNIAKSFIGFLYIIRLPNIIVRVKMIDHIDRDTYISILIDSITLVL